MYHGTAIQLIEFYDVLLLAKVKNMVVIAHKIIISQKVAHTKYPKAVQFKNKKFRAQNECNKQTYRSSGV